MLPIDHFPLITNAGYQLLRRLQEHPRAPRYTHPGYNRLTPEGLRRAREFEVELRDAPPNWAHGEIPHWLKGFVEQCYRDVPIYRRDGPAPVTLSAAEGFFDLPTLSRADLNREPWAFVPDSQPLDGLVVYNTSGTTGHPLDILTHADTLALYVPLLRAALAAHGLTLEGGAERVAIVLVCFQKKTYTYAAISAVLDQAGFVKINLNPDEWRDPADRARFLDECAPEIITGDPLAFQQLADLPGLRTRPKALVSTAMALTPGLAQALEEHFSCPVLDVYSTNESGPIGVKVPSVEVSSAMSPSLTPDTPTRDAYMLLQPHLYVEILDSDGAPCPPGERGEITLSGGFNPFLPLLRYRTGDYAALEFRGVPGRHIGRHMGLPLLVGLEGRPPVAFRAADGRPVNNVDVSIALRPFPIAQYALHQSADGALHLIVRGAGVTLGQLRAALLELFGADQALNLEEVDRLDVPGGKLVQYTSDLV